LRHQFTSRFQTEIVKNNFRSTIPWSCFHGQVIITPAVFNLRLRVSCRCFYFNKTDSQNAFEGLNNINKPQRLGFGYLSYDLKMMLSHCNLVFWWFGISRFIFFFQPKKIFFWKAINLKIPQSCDEEFEGLWWSGKNSKLKIWFFNKITIREFQKAAISKKCQNAKSHSSGLIWDLNFCMEFYAENANIEPLGKISETKRNFDLICVLKTTSIFYSITENAIWKGRGTTFSQPIKGTAKRCFWLGRRWKSKIQLASDPNDQKTLWLQIWFEMTSIRLKRFG
jgi:para-aminobenzoate synthetase component 1